MSGYQVGEPVVTGGLTVGGAITVSGQVDVGAPVAVSGDGSQIGDTHTAPVDVPVMLVRGADGIFRPRTPTPADVGAAPAEHTHPDPWGSRVRVGTADPADEAPVGAVHVNALTGRIFRNEG